MPAGKEAYGISRGTSCDPCRCGGPVEMRACPPKASVGGGGPESALASIFRPTLFFLELFLLGEQKKKWIGMGALSIQ